jgi:internalin A
VAGQVTESQLSSDESSAARENFEVLQAYHADVRRVAEQAGLTNTQRLYLAPFNDEQVRDFTRHWWMHHRGNPALAAAESEEFLAALHAKKDTRTLGRVPNLLVLIALVYKVFVKLPDGRAELYWKIAEAYLENIDRSYHLKQRLPHGFRQMADWLGHVAWQMQLRRHQESTLEKKDEQEQPRTEILITHAEALDHLTAAIQQEVSSEVEARSLAVTFLDYAARRSGLFIPRGVDAQHQELYAFMHLSFQEFFCAVYLQERVGRMSWWRENVFAQKDSSPSALHALRQYAARTEWMEVFVFLFEMLQVGDPDKPTDFLRALLDEPQAENGWRSFDAPFPELFSAKAKASAHPPRLPQAHLVELVATLGMNSEVRLAPATRQQLLQHAWEWETRRCADGDQLWAGNNAVARELLARRADLSASWQALGTLGASVQKLYLNGCTALSDLQPLQALSSLQYLDLNGCTALSDLQPLQALPSLQYLSLTGCTALSDLQPLHALSSLQYLYLNGCTGVKDSPVIAALEKRKVSVFGP